MTTERAISHFEYKLTNSWKPTKHDLEAYNALLKYIETKKKETIINNQLFGKLYIYLFGEFITYYNASIFDEIPQKELHKILDTDLRVLVTNLRDKLNLKEVEDYIIKEKSLKGFKEIEYEEIADNLKSMINGAISQYNK